MTELTPPTLLDFEVAYYGEVYSETADEYISDGDIDWECEGIHLDSVWFNNTNDVNSSDCYVVLKHKETGVQYGLRIGGLPSSWQEESWSELYEDEQIHLLTKVDPLEDEILAAAE